MSTQPFAELICAYLDGLHGAADVLNDALEEAGRSRLAVEGSPSERLALVLEQLLTEPLARRVAVDFARRMVGYCESPLAQALIDQKQVRVAPTSSPAEVERADARLSELREGELPFQHDILYLLGWGQANTPQASAAWALWGALQIPVRYVAGAAQRAKPSELDWQIEHLKHLLSQ